MTSRAWAGVAIEPVAEAVADDALHESLGLGVAELGLGLALELRLGELDRDDRGQALADVVAGEVVVLLLEDALLPRVLVDQRGQRGAEALFVGAALVRVDRVGVGVDALGVRVGPLHRDLEGDLALGVLGLEGDDVLVDDIDLLAGVEVLDVVDQAVVVLVDDGVEFRGISPSVGTVSRSRSSSSDGSSGARRSSVSVMRRPLLRKAICWKRARSVS